MLPRLLLTTVFTLIGGALVGQASVPAAMGSAASKSGAALDRFDFMLGLWKGPLERGNQRHVEAWTWQNDSTLIAEVFTERRQRPTQAPDTLDAQTWVLRADGRQVMLIRPPVDPADGMPVRYLLTATGPRRASFSNTEVAFPQQITYELTLRGELLISFAGQLSRAARYGQTLLRPSH